MSNSARSNLDTEPYDGSWESGHSTEMIVCLSIIAATMTAIPVVLLIRYFLLKQALKKRTIDAAAKYAHPSDDDDWHSTHDDIGQLPETQSRPIKAGHAGDPERGLTNTTMPPPDTDAAAVGKKEEVKEEAPRGMWETIAKRIG